MKGEINHKTYLKDVVFVGEAVVVDGYALHSSEFIYGENAKCYESDLPYEIIGG